MANKILCDLIPAYSSNSHTTLPQRASVTLALCWAVQCAKFFPVLGPLPGVYMVRSSSFKL